MADLLYDSGYWCCDAVAAIVSTHTDRELSSMFQNLSEYDLSFFNNTTTAQFVKHLLTKGTLQDIGFLQKRLRMLIGDLTFAEAYERTGRQAASFL